MAQTNKWIFFACVIYSLAKFEFFEMFAYIYDHPYIIIDILNNAIMNNICQFFVYYMIQKFRQHIVPFIITIRKIFSVVLSIVWFNH
jgi:UDP-galactose transporter B1